MALQVIGLIGVIGSGKSFLAQEYVKQGYVELPMAKTLKDILSIVLGVDFHQEEVKKMVFDLPNGKFNGRELLIKLGDEVRAENPYFWANAWKNSATDVLDSKRSIVIPDVRYTEEIVVISKVTLQVTKSFFYGIPIEERFIFCNYKSDRYNADNDYKSEKLAQHLLKKGLKHGHELNYAELLKLISLPCRR